MPTTKLDKNIYYIPLIQRTVLQGLNNYGRGRPAGSELGVRHHVEDVVGVGF